MKYAFQSSIQVWLVVAGEFRSAFNSTRCARLCEDCRCVATTCRVPLGGDAQHPPPPGAGTSINYESYLAEIRHGLAQQRIQPCCTLQAHNTTQAQGCVEKQLIACNLYSQLEITHACNMNTKKQNRADPRGCILSSVSCHSESNAVSARWLCLGRMSGIL